MSLMKKFMKIFVPVAAAAMAFGSCAKENKAPSAAEAVRISVIASPEEAAPTTPATSSKTYIGTLEGVENSIIWGKGEYMYLYITSGGSTDITKSSSESADIWEGEGKAMFAFDATPAAGDNYLYQGIYPSSAVVESSNTNPANLKVSLPETQKPTAASYDPAAYIMVACPQDFKEVQTEWLAYFRRAVALNKWTLTGLENGVISVDIILPEGSNLAGRRYINLSTGESGEVYSGANSIKLSYDTALGAGEQTLWFTSWGLVLPAGQQLTIVAKTSGKSYSRTITAKEAGIIFKEGALNTLRVDMSSAAEEEIDSYAGKYLIAGIKDNKWQLMNPVVGDASHYPALATGIAADEANVDFETFAGVADIDNYIWSVDASDEAYTFRSNFTSKYLSYYGSSNNAYAVADPSASTLFFINSYDAATKVAEIESKDVAGRKLFFNSSQPRFAFYASAQAAVHLIPAVADERASIKLSFEEPAVELTTTNSGAFSGQAATSDPEVTAIEYSWDAEDAFGMLDEASGEVLLSGVEGSATITATFAGDENYKPASASYTVTVIDASKSYYVKVTTEQTDWSGEYLIVYEANSVAWNGSLENLDSTPNTFEVTISGGKIERTDATMGKAFFIDPMEGGYSILASNGKYIGRSGGSNGLDTGSQPLLNVITWDNHPVITGEGGRTIGFNSASNQLKFRYLGNSDIELYIFDDKREKCATPTFSVAAGEVEAGTVVTISSTTEGADIYYTTNGNIPTKDSGTKGTSVTIDATTTLKAIAVKEGFRNSAVAEATYTVAGSGNDGTLEHPYTATEVLGIASTENDVYVAGTIKSITEVSTGYGNATYTITDNTSDALVYRGRFVANTAFTAADQIKVGDEVIICGKISQHNNVSQLAQGNYIYSLNGITKVLTAPVVTASADDNTKVVTVSWDAVEGASVYDVVCGDKSANNINGTSTTITMDDFGTYNVSVTAKASDAFSATGTAVVTLIDPSASHTAVADGTVLFNESFAGFSKDDVPSSSNSSTVVYDDATLTYSCVNGTSATKVYEDALAAGELPEILVGKSGGSFTINAIPTGWAEKMTLTFKTNKNNLSVSSPTAGVTVGTATSIAEQYLVVITNDGPVGAFNLVFTAGADNARLDDIHIVAGEVKVLTAPVVTATGNNDNKQVSVSWGAVTGATSYDVTCGTKTQSDVTGTSATFTMDSYGTFSITVTAKAANSIPATGAATVTLTDPSSSAPQPVTVTFTGENSGGMTTSQAAQTGTLNGVTINISNGVVSGSQIRIYKNQTITISAPTGKTLTSVVFTCTASGTAQYGPGCFASHSGYTYSGTKGTWTGNESSLTLTASSNQVRATEIKVTYQ